jgi:transcriptional regulator with XRE-family HTH domain
MNSPNLNAKLPANELGALLRHWRVVRGKSQFDLALDAGVSQRHISFIESGRSVPSRRTLLGVAQALDIPLRADLCGERLGRAGNGRHNRRAATHVAPARAISRRGDGSLLECADDQ